MDGDKVVACACGVRWQGPIDELIPLVREHRHEAHSTDVTDEQVMAMAVDAAGRPAPVFEPVCEQPPA